MHICLEVYIAQEKFSFIDWEIFLTLNVNITRPLLRLFKDAVDKSLCEIATKTFHCDLIQNLWTWCEILSRMEKNASYTHRHTHTLTHKYSQIPLLFTYSSCPAISRICH